jgi:hypothetical protein
MEQALSAWYRERNADAPTVRVQRVEGNLLYYTTRWSLGD